MDHTSKEKEQTTHDGRNETTKSRQDYKKETYKYLSILEVDTIK